MLFVLSVSNKCPIFLTALDLNHLNKIRGTLKIIVLTFTQYSRAYCNIFVSGQETPLSILFSTIVHVLRYVKYEVSHSLEKRVQL